MSSKIKIEIIAIGENKIYSAGAIEMSPNGDIYIVYKIKGDGGFHTSRHRDGKLHWKSKKCNVFIKIGDRVPIKNFNGIEFLGTHAFGLGSLPELYTEYKMKKCNGIFAIDMKEYKDSAFNMTVSILTEDGLPALYNNWKEKGKRQIYIYTNSHPMIAIMAADIKS